MKKLHLHDTKYNTGTSIVGLILIGIMAVGILSITLFARPQSFGRVVAEDLKISACQRLNNQSDKTCFDLSGQVYVVSANNTERILKELLGIVERRSLSQGSTLNDIDKQRFVDEFTNPSNKEFQEAYAKDPRSVGLYISLAFSGGLFGEYSFPSRGTEALYVSAFVKDADTSFGDAKYVLRSEFRITEAQAEVLARQAEALKSDEYFLLVAQ